MPSPNIIQFSLDETYRKKLADLSKDGESIGLIAKRLIIEILDREGSPSQKLPKDENQRIDTLELSIETIDTQIYQLLQSNREKDIEIDLLKQSIKSIDSRLDSLEQSKKDIPIQPEPDPSPTAVSDSVQNQQQLNDSTVAQMLGVAKATPARWRTGVRKMSPEVQSKLADIGVALDGSRWIKV